MSYIHDALRKAQREKDAGYRHYEAALPSGRGRGRKGTFGSRAALSTLFMVLVFAFLTVLVYNHFTGAEKNDTHSAEVALAPGSSPATVPAVKEKGAETAQPLPALEELYREALARQRQGDIAGAERAYEQILARDSAYVFALNNLGVIRLNQGAREKARALFEEAIGIDGGYVDPLYNMACLHARSGNRAGALEALRNAWRLDVTILEWAEGDADLAALCESVEYRKTFYTNGEDKAQ